jgi:murein DD-endopeptidase MepM/ murein hydrolase activator NlpD
VQSTHQQTERTFFCATMTGSLAMVACALAILGLLLPFPDAAQRHSPYPVDITVGPLPQAIAVNGQIRLAYELHLTNFAPWPVEVTAIDVLGDGAKPLASFDRDALNNRVVPVEKVLLSLEPDPTGKSRTLDAGHSVIIFIDVTLDRGAAAPAQLHHRFSFSNAGDDGAPVARTIDVATIPVVQEPTPVLRAPLRGSGWIAFNALSAYEHRRAFNPVDGRLRIAQRFAIDWGRIGPDGRMFRGDGKSNTDYYNYGAEVVAVADARVSDIKDSLPDNTGASERSDRKVTLDNAVGNDVILDLGHGKFAVYAHLQPGSLKVKVGDKVKAGQPLALLGNSGNSDAPHLHFQVVDASSPLGAEGLPYEIESFTVLGVLDNASVLDTGNPWKPKPQEKPIVHRAEFPGDNSVVSFP